MKKSLISVLFLSILGCSFPGVYRLDVQQGNIVERSDIEQLELGMTRKQVHYVLGSPVFDSTFSPDQEVYLYTIQLGGGTIHEQKVILQFDDEDTLIAMDTRSLLKPELANPAQAYKTKKAD